MFQTLWRQISQTLSKKKENNFLWGVCACLILSMFVQSPDLVALFSCCSEETKLGLLYKKATWKTHILKRKKEIWIPVLRLLVPMHDVLNFLFLFKRLSSDKSYLPCTYCLEVIRNDVTKKMGWGFIWECVFMCTFESGHIFCWIQLYSHHHPHFLQYFLSNVMKRSFIFVVLSSRKNLVANN